MFDPDALAWWSLLNQETGAPTPPCSTNHIHVWKSLLEQAGSLDDIPKEGRLLVVLVRPGPAGGAPPPAVTTSGVWPQHVGPGLDTQNQFFQFLSAYDADYVAQDGRLIIDDPESGQPHPGDRRLHRGLPQGLRATRLDRLGPNFDNNKQFHAQAVVIVLNDTPIPNALKRERSEDYYKTPRRSNGRSARIWPFPGLWRLLGAVVFKDGCNVETAKEFVRFLVAEGWLAHYLDFAGERFATNAEAARGAALARSERPAPHGRGDVARAHAVPVRRGLGRLETTTGQEGLGEGDPPRRR